MNKLVKDCYSGCFNEHFGATLIDHFINHVKGTVEIKCIVGLSIPGVSSTIFIDNLNKHLVEPTNCRGGDVIPALLMINML